MKPWLTKKEYELYMYLKEKHTLNILVKDLAKILNEDNSDTSRRLNSLQKKGYILRNLSLITVT